MAGFDAARAAIENMYCGTCAVYERRKATDGATKITAMHDEASLQGARCRLSYEKCGAAEKEGGAAAAGASVKLFIAPDAPIRPGSKIEVTQNGVTEWYAASGAPAIYPTHQEVALEKLDRRA